MRERFGWTFLRPGGTKIGTEVWARPVNRSVWNDWTGPADSDSFPIWEEAGFPWDAEEPTEARAPFWVMKLKVNVRSTLREMTRFIGDLPC